MPPAKLALLPNFVDADALIPVPAPNALTRELGLDGRFIVSYAGNLGPAQGLETLLDAARLLRDLDAVVIVLIGAGSMWDTLERRIREEATATSGCVPYLPFARVPEIYGATNLSLVPLAASTGADAVPLEGVSHHGLQRGRAGDDRRAFRPGPDRARRPGAASSSIPARPRPSRPPSGARRWIRPRRRRWARARASWCWTGTLDRW